MNRRDFRRARRAVIREARLRICGGKLAALWAAIDSFSGHTSDLLRTDWMFFGELPLPGRVRLRHREVMSHLSTLDPRRLP